MAGEMKALEVFTNYPVQSEDIQDWYTWRCKVQDGIARMKEILKEFDEEMMQKMDDLGTASFDSGMEGGKVRVIKGKVKKDKITDIPRLVKMLQSPDEATREMAFLALSGSQSAWKVAQVKILADTLGIEGLVATTNQDKLEIKVIPQAILDAKHKPKGV